MIDKFYTVSYFTTFGLRLYLSNVGFHIASGRGLIFEAEFRNARQFDTRAEAKKIAKQAEQSEKVPMIVQKHVVQENGSMQITVV
jgi:hypothetical protein